MKLAVRMGWYILEDEMRGQRCFPLAATLEPLEACNLPREQWGRMTSENRG